MQDEHILARKYADKWMVKALGVGLFKRKLHRREVEDTRQLLLSTINPLARVSALLWFLPQKNTSCLYDLVFAASLLMLNKVARQLLLFTVNSLARVSALPQMTFVHP